MTYLTIALAYLLGAFPTGYIAGRWSKDIDIREIGDRNMGAQNAFHYLGHRIGFAVFFIDVAKGAGAILVANLADVSAFTVYAAGISCVIGHNWPVFLGFRGGRGEATTIGVFLVLLTTPTLIVAPIAFVVLYLSKNVIVTSTFLFVLIVLMTWWMNFPGDVVLFSILLPSLVGITHFVRSRETVTSEVDDGFL